MTNNTLSTKDAAGLLEYPMSELPTATEEMIQKKFRKASLKYHPDKNKEGTEKFLEITAAKEKLLDDLSNNLIGPMMVNVNNNNGGGNGIPPAAAAAAAPRPADVPVRPAPPAAARPAPPAAQQQQQRRQPAAAAEPTTNHHRGFFNGNHQRHRNNAFDDDDDEFENNEPDYDPEYVQQLFQQVGPYWHIIEQNVQAAMGDKYKKRYYTEFNGMPIPEYVREEQRRKILIHKYRIRFAHEFLVQQQRQRQQQEDAVRRQRAEASAAEAAAAAEAARVAAAAAAAAEAQQRQQQPQPPTNAARDDDNNTMDDNDDDDVPAYDFFNPDSIWEEREAEFELQQQREQKFKIVSTVACRSVLVYNAVNYMFGGTFTIIIFVMIIGVYVRTQVRRRRHDEYLYDFDAEEDEFVEEVPTI